MTSRNPSVASGRPTGTVPGLRPGAKHAAAHPWYRGLRNNRHWQQFEEEARTAARGIAAGLLTVNPVTRNPKPVTRSLGGRPSKLGIVVPYNRTRQPREYHRAYMAQWKKRNL